MSDYSKELRDFFDRSHDGSARPIGLADAMMIGGAADEIDSLRTQLASARKALEPFANFMSDHMPDDFVITRGSGFARQQLTMADCRKAKAALTDDLRGSHEG